MKLQATLHDAIGPKGAQSSPTRAKGKKSPKRPQYGPLLVAEFNAIASHKNGAELLESARVFLRMVDKLNLSHELSEQVLKLTRLAERYKLHTGNRASHKGCTNEKMAKRLGTSIRSYYNIVLELLGIEKNGSLQHALEPHLTKGGHDVSALVFNILELGKPIKLHEVLKSTEELHAISPEVVLDAIAQLQKKEFVKLVKEGNVTCVQRLKESYDYEDPATDDEFCSKSLRAEEIISAADEIPEARKVLLAADGISYLRARLHDVDEARAAGLAVYHMEESEKHSDRVSRLPRPKRATYGSVMMLHEAPETSFGLKRDVQRALISWQKSTLLLHRSAGYLHAEGIKNFSDRLNAARQKFEKILDEAMEMGTGERTEFVASFWHAPLQTVVAPLVERTNGKKLVKKAVAAVIAAAMFVSMAVHGDWSTPAGENRHAEGSAGQVVDMSLKDGQEVAMADNNAVNHLDYPILLALADNN